MLAVLVQIKAVNEQQGNPLSIEQVDVGVFESQRPTEDNPSKATTLSVKVARYNVDMTPFLKRPTTAEVGFSLFNYTEK